MNDLQQLLRRHDPGADAQLPLEQRHRIRAAMFAARRDDAPSLFLRRLAAAVMSIVVLSTVTFGLMKQREAPPPEIRRVEYTTPGGTRVIWTLDPSFHM